MSFLLFIYQLTKCIKINIIALTFSVKRTFFSKVRLYILLHTHIPVIHSIILVGIEFIQFEAYKAAYSV